MPLPIAGAILGIAGKFLAADVLKFLATRALLLSLFTFVLPVVLYNVFSTILQETMNYASSQMGTGWTGTLIEFTGLAAWMGQRLLAMGLTELAVLVVTIATLIIFLTVPLAIIGVAGGLLVTGQPFGFMALLGFLSLTGMLIKNAIVLIDEINVQIGSGKEPFTAIVDSGLSRMRPVSSGCTACAARATRLR